MLKICLAEQKWRQVYTIPYSAMVNTAKAMLTMENVKTNTHISIIKDFDENLWKQNVLRWKTALKILAPTNQ